MTKIRSALAARWAEFARCFWHCETTVATVALMACTALSWVQLCRTDAQLFTAKTVMQVLDFSSKPLFLWWCGLGLFLALVGRLTRLQGIYVLALLWLVFWWAGITRILLAFTSTDIALANTFALACLAAWLAARHAERYFPDRLRPWLRRHPRSLLTRLSAYDDEG